MFTDSWIVGGPVTLGPYLFLNTCAHAGMPEDSLKPALFVRVDAHHEDEQLPMVATDTDTYHGGDIKDEIAALTSLSLGIRMKAGSTTRRFTPRDGDPRGTPLAFEGFGEPALIIRGSGLILRSATGRHSLDHLEALRLLPAVSPPASAAVVRSARLYQESVWVCESEPAIAWLLMVSAAECAADHFIGTSEPAVARLRASKPRLCGIIEQRCPDLLEEVANEIMESLGATQKFVKFLLHFLPDAPAGRPPIGLQVPWSKNKLRPILSKIYDYRSKALHAGVPFPAPMCFPPRTMMPGWGGPEERPLGLATSTRGGVWLAKDTPVHFHVFEHLVRGALLNWWRHLSGVT